MGVRTRGCSGLTYTLDYANEKMKMDEEVVQDGKFYFYYCLIRAGQFNELPIQKFFQPLLQTSILHP